jgi:3-deoxy-manno-octulosonate cytidylyltransferase (CMP-KDO synthetase)
VVTFYVDCYDLLELSVMKALICIPARYAATRLPGKPLVKLAGKTLVERLVSISRVASEQITIPTDIVVATDDNRVITLCKELDINCLMTSPECRTGSDRSREAVNQLGQQHDIIASVQVDVPLTPPHVITKMVNTLIERKESSLATPVVHLTWSELDSLRDSKTRNPFSGCTVIVNKEGKALWFSKQIIPGLRNEKDLREKDPVWSPIIQHIGIYTYRKDLLLNYSELDTGFYEQLESLEQLRAIENGYHIEAVEVDYKGWVRMSGIDSPDDLERAEQFIKTRGEVLDYFKH